VCARAREHPAEIGAYGSRAHYRNARI